MEIIVVIKSKDMSYRDFVNWLWVKPALSYQSVIINITMRKIVLLWLILQVVTGFNVEGQENISSADTSKTIQANGVDTGTVTRSAGAQYAASGWKRLWW